MRSELELPDGSKAVTVTDPSGLQTVIVERRHSFDAGEAEPLDIEAPFSVYVPHTARHPETIAGSPANATWVNVAQSEVAYYAALATWWDAGETFLVLEHDIVCRADVIEEAAACPEPWCIWPYDPICHRECMEAWRNALGCTRFRAELITAVPDALTSIPPDGWDWHNVCDGLGHNLRAAGFTHHWHEPAVHHHRAIGRDIA